jgi:enoyl-CoA hydratase
MIPAGGASQTLPRVVGTSAALRAVITGERVPARDALHRGFVDEVVPRAELRTRTAEVSTVLADRPAAAVQAAKAAVWAALDLPLDVGIAREADLAASLRAG